MPTAPQIKRLFTLATKAGLTTADVHAETDRRYGKQHTKYLSDHQYEQFTRLIIQGDIKPGVVPPAERDIDEIRDGKYLCSRGAIRVAVGMMADEGLLWDGASGIDAGVLGDMLDCIRLYRRSWRRITLEQARTMVIAWTHYPLPVWRDAARRYLAQHTTKDEKYFAGILRRVAHEHSQPQPAAVAP